MSFLKNLKGMAEDLKKMLPKDEEAKKKEAAKRELHLADPLHIKSVSSIIELD